MKAGPYITVDLWVESMRGERERDRGKIITVYMREIEQNLYSKKITVREKKRKMSAR